MSWISNFQNIENPNNAANNQEELKYNAKIYFKENESPPNYDLYSGSNQPQSCFQNSLSGIQEVNAVSSTFFSKQNVDLIQNKIIEKIFQESNGLYKIGRQSDLQLQIIMRSIYLSYGKNMDSYIQEQINELNKYVIDESVKNIIPNIKQYLGYREDIRKPRQIMAHPVNPSMKGGKTYSLMIV